MDSRLTMKDLTELIWPILSGFINPPNIKSSLGIKYSKLRDFPLRVSQLWLNGKKHTDAAEDLWRIHDGLYDLNQFINRHPGGTSWIKLTKGTDITEAFESHHISTLPETILPEFFIRKTSQPRNSPFTFEKNGFYNTLKQNIRKTLKDVPKWIERRSKIYTDIIFLNYLLFTFLATYFSSYTLGVVAGFSLNWLSTAAHNFMHKKENFRTYYFDLTLLRSRAWQISHILSHHMYTNTVQDLEISTLEPFLQLLPHDKHFFFRYISWIYSPVFYSFIFLGHWVMELSYCIWKGKGFSPVQIIPFTIPLVMYYITGQSALSTVLMFLWIIMTSSLFFGIVGINGAHHHPDLFHDGDAPRPKEELDWGVHQLDAVRDRTEITGTPLLVLTNYGDHGLHHLFPTLDHGVLDYLYPVFNETCKQFGIDFPLVSQMHMVRGQFYQLARTKPRLIPPKPLRKIEQNLNINKM